MATRRGNHKVVGKGVLGPSSARTENAAGRPSDTSRRGRRETQDTLHRSSDRGLCEMPSFSGERHGEKSYFELGGPLREQFAAKPSGDPLREWYVAKNAAHKRRLLMWATSMFKASSCNCMPFACSTMRSSSRFMCSCPA